MMYSNLTVVQCIKLARLRWAGNVVRIETDDQTRKVFLGRPQGQRSLGRPKLRWKKIDPVFIPEGDKVSMEIYIGFLSKYVIVWTKEQYFPKQNVVLFAVQKLFAVTSSALGERYVRWITLYGATWRQSPILNITPVHQASDKHWPVPGEKWMETIQGFESYNGVVQSVKRMFQTGSEIVQALCGGLQSYYEVLQTSCRIWQAYCGAVIRLWVPV